MSCVADWSVHWLKQLRLVPIQKLRRESQCLMSAQKETGQNMSEHFHVLYNTGHSSIFCNIVETDRETRLMHVSAMKFEFLPHTVNG